MFRNVTPEKAIEFTRVTVSLTCCWPPPSTATKSQVLHFKVFRGIMLLNAFTLLLPLLYALHVHRDDSIELSKTACLTFAVIQLLVQTFFSITQYDRFQRLIDEMMITCKQATRHERYIFQRYIHKYSTFYGVSVVWFYLSALVVVMGTLLISQPFPTNAEYPFRVDREPLRVIVFLHQALVGMQCASHVNFNMFCALLLFFAAARFDILRTELRSVTDMNGLIKCVRKYYCVKRYAQEVADTVRFIVLLTIAMCGVVLALCAINFIEKQPFPVRVQFSCLAGTALLEVFMCAWPADRLIDVTQNVVQGAYESKWYQQSLNMQKHVLYTMIPQKPVTISIKCVIPMLSLSYYCSYISNVFSFFTALRVVMVKNENDN